MTGCDTFDKWCQLHGETPLPAVPVVVAKFVADIAATGIEKIWPMIGQISRAHYLIGLADPTLGGAVSTALNAIAKIEPPRSWPNEHKFRFTALPYDLQAYLAVATAAREAELRRAQNEAVDLRKKLEAIEKSERADRGTSKQDAA